ncbi:PX domain-containing protein kinase-like protein isoform X2 [Tigriopus californicus]|uniref:PX domain-containing protein kinase-like protein isoform X2 n=1 Tax=Tigriopus californicus TaxID=6832 RepID=UPI0027DA6A7B|nr:PX domain-containing protein kinase-like protein isoform X2 [Tigriopus californicus]
MVQMQEYIVQTSHLPSSANYALSDLSSLQKLELLSWTVRRRYSDFRNLKAVIQESSGLDFSFPAKKITGNLNEDFVASRQSGLQGFLDQVLAHPYLRTSTALKRFLDDVSWRDNFQDLALHSVSNFCRANESIQIERVLHNMGWRTRKIFFQVKGPTGSNDEMFLVWSQLRLANQLSEKTMQSICRSLSLMEHPYLSTVHACALSNAGGVFVRYMSPLGSLRDIMHGSRPKSPFLRKYVKTQKVRTFPEPDLCLMSWQMLHGLMFLRDKGLGHGNLTTSNVHFGGGNVKIASFENFFLGLPGFYRPWAVQLKQPSKSLANFDVYCFGHVLFELATGFPLNQTTMKEALSKHSEEMNSLLWSILSLESTKASDYPSFDSLLHHPWFNDFRNKTFSSPTLKFSQSTKEVIAKVKQAVEERLTTDHKLFKAYQRDQRRKSVLNSNTEKRKRQLLRELSVPRNETRVTPTIHPTPPSVTKAVVTERKVGNGSGTLPSSHPPPPPPAPSKMPKDEIKEQNAPGHVAPNSNRSALLGSIASFQKGSLRKAETKDRSAPKI